MFAAYSSHTSREMGFRTRTNSVFRPPGVPEGVIKAGCIQDRLLVLSPVPVRTLRLRVLQPTRFDQGMPVLHLAAYPNGRYIVSADLTTIKVRQ